MPATCSAKSAVLVMTFFSRNNKLDEGNRWSNVNVTVFYMRGQRLADPDDDIGNSCRSLRAADRYSCTTRPAEIPCSAARRPSKPTASSSRLFGRRPCTATSASSDKYSPSNSTGTPGVTAGTLGDVNQPRVLQSR